MARILMVAYTNYRRDPRVRREAEALVEEGHEVTFLASRQPGQPNEEVIDGVRVIKLPGLGNHRRSIAIYLLDYGLFFLLATWHITLRPLRYALIHVNNMPDFLVFSAWLPRLLGRPVIHDVHDLMPELYGEKFGEGRGGWMIWLLKLQERWAGRFATAVLTVEERLRKILASRGIPIEKIHVLMNLPDDRIFKPRPAPPVKKPGDPFVIVYHGTLARRLGLDLAIEAVGLLRESIPNLELRIIGDGEERLPLIALRDRLDLKDRVTFSDGFVPVQQIPEMIADADMGLVPLRISAGTDIMLPTKLLEYVSLGIPTACPRTTTIGMYFDEDMVEFFEAGDVESLAAAIMRLHSAPNRAAGLVAQSEARFGRKYRWTSHKVIYAALVRRHLNGQTVDG
jgi:glycosyltransferase involved in cell wall biosynthesis